MKKQTEILCALIGAILFNFIFWQERLALNVLLYTVFILVVILSDRSKRNNKKIRLFGLSHLIAAALVVYNNSDLTLIAWYFSLAVFIGFAFNTTLRSIFFAIFAAVLQLIAFPLVFFQRLKLLSIGNFSLLPAFRSAKYIVIPIVLVFLFGMIYSYASPDLSHYLNLIGATIGDFFNAVFNFLFADVSFVRILFFIFGLFITGALLFCYRQESLVKFEGSLLEKMIRVRKKKKKTLAIAAPQRKMIGLKVENTIGILSFAALNFLLLSLNLIDILNLWLTETKVETLDYSSEVHQGTNALIGSIVLAMIVILYFFRSNLNFYKNNRYIKLFAYVWIFQNTFLVASVLLKDYNYIHMHGLTYKRIGVLVFLLLCLIGLATVYLKVKHQKTLFYLLKTNGITWYALLLFFSFFNWDLIIMRYNINHNYDIVTDLQHLWRMSDKVIPAADFYRRKNQKTVDPTRSSVSNDFNQAVERRIIWFRERRQRTSWLSWNYRDWQTDQYLDGKKTFLTD